MAKKESAGIVLYRYRDSRLEIFLVHPGGPFWKNKDEGAWSIPKGEYEPGEEPLAVARREFREEIGRDAPAGEPFELGEVRQPSGKRVRAWALEADLDVTTINSNMFELQWPPGSGRMQQFPEVDRAGWFDLETAER